MDREFLFDLAKIVEGAANGDHEKVVAYGEELAARLESDGERAAAKRMRQIIGKSRASSVMLARSGTSPPVPVDGESRIPVADEERPCKDDVAVFLPEDTQRTVNQFLACFRAADKLIANGVGISPSLLMYGPPGVGKTQLARYVAAQLGYPLITARSDALISSYLGSTAKNLRSLFEHAASRPCILFLDEFDALAKMRDDDRELGELKRVVISLMQNIDAMGRDHLLLAATNHEHLLDPAIWRRFSYKVELKSPDVVAREAMFKHFLGRFSDEATVEFGAALSDGVSGAQIRDICEDAVRTAVLNDKTRVALPEIVPRITGESDLGAQFLALEKLGKKRITQDRMGELYGMPQPRVSEQLKKARQRGTRNG